MTSRRAAALLATAFLLAALPSHAESHGKFHFGKVAFEPSDAMAFQITGEDGKPITVIAVSDFKIDRPAVIAAINPVNEVMVQASAKSRNSVFIRPIPPNRCALFGFLGQTNNNINLGESFSAKVSASSAARAAGECRTTKTEKMFDDEYDFDLSYDVPLTPIPRATPLAAGGGEPGSAYLALAKAIQAKDYDAICRHLSGVELPKHRLNAGERDNFFANLVANYPTNVTVSGGLLKNDLALIDVHGRHHDGQNVKGTVAMKRSDGQWRVVDQSFYGE